MKACREKDYAEDQTSILVHCCLHNALCGLKLQLLFSIRDSRKGSYNSLGDRCESCFPRRETEAVQNHPTLTQRLATAESKVRDQHAAGAVEAWSSAPVRGREVSVDPSASVEGGSEVSVSV